MVAERAQGLEDIALTLSAVASRRPGAGSAEASPSNRDEVELPPASSRKSLIAREEVSKAMRGEKCGT